ncbi:hypothetical protein L1987_26712 [Smallanthus sonchifolius]|uniref:Uncharacterized protein n=1 Tax=Smallanthus sonchifolius TaxID=185202 RepID=A0ACB9IBW3_9ASTR|nr:hypothetical protein L1987_26712 [Smallanthus sonchifolius]
MDTRLNRQHHQEDQGKDFDFHMGFVNSEDDDMEAFFATSNTHNQILEAEEVDENLEVAECLMLHARGHTSMVDVHVEELKEAIDVERKAVRVFDLNVAPGVEEYNHQ